MGDDMRVETIAADNESVTKRFGNSCDVRVELGSEPVRFAVTAEGETWDCEVFPSEGTRHFGFPD